MMDPRPGDELMDVSWDLRDEAFDAPARWAHVTPVLLFQVLAEGVEAETKRNPSAPIAVDVLAAMLLDAAHRARDWSPSTGSPET